MYRKALFDAGFVTGFQWLDGSFVENVEVTQGRAPNDVDVLTAFHRPIRYQSDQALWRQAYPQLYHALFDPGRCKTQYSCDTYAMDLNTAPEGVVEQAAYWQGLFSAQRRTLNPKGMIEIPLLTDASAHASELALSSGTQ